MIAEILFCTFILLYYLCINRVFPSKEKPVDTFP